MTRRALVWPAAILCSAFAAGLVDFVIPGAIGRPIIVMWLMFACPGMVVVRYFRLSEPIAEWTLAIALSLAIDALVSGVQLYAGWWSTSGSVGIIICFCIVGAIVQIVQLKI